MKRKRRTPGGPDANYPGADYAADELEFLRAIERYRQTRHRRYPTSREILAVLKSLGYRKVSQRDAP